MKALIFMFILGLGSSALAGGQSLLGGKDVNLSELLGSLKSSLVMEDELLNLSGTLGSVTQVWEDLRVVILSQGVNVLPLQGNLIEWRDQRVSEEALYAYDEHFKGKVQSVGAFYEQGVESKEFVDRPFQNQPVLVLKNNVQGHVLIHELLHLWISKVSDLAGLSEDLDRIGEGVGEEVFVDTFMLEHAEQFKLSESDICFRRKYLSQNLQVLKSNMGDMSKDERTFIASDYFESYKVSESYRMKCILQGSF
ncbi:MAG: hypothetical protein ACRBBP_05990 [Bdellovibrionales bacterium]